MPHAFAKRLPSNMRSVATLQARRAQRVDAALDVSALLGDADIDRLQHVNSPGVGLDSPTYFGAKRLRSVGAKLGVAMVRPLVFAKCNLLSITQDSNKGKELGLTGHFHVCLTGGIAGRAVSSKTEDFSFQFFFSRSRS